MCLDENDYPVKPNGTVVPIHLTLYFSEWRAKFQERQMQNKLAKAKREASWQTKDSAPNAQSNVTAPPLPPYLFCWYTVMRVEQAQECWIDTVRNDEFIEGYVCLDKNPV